MKLRSILLPLCIAVLISAGRPAGAQTLEKPIYRFSLFDAIDHPGGVYLCTVTGREPTQGSREAGRESGKVSLAVRRTLHGAPRQSLILPYSFVTTQYKNASDFAWPALDRLEGRSLLCVVNRGVVDTTAPKFPEIAEAASQLFVVEGDGALDASVRMMEKVCQLYDAIGTGDAIPAIREAVRDPEARVRVFALQAMVVKLAETNPDEAIRILRESVSRWDTAGDPIEVGLVGAYLHRKLYVGDRQKETLNWIPRCLAVLVVESTRARESALDVLRFRARAFRDIPEYTFPESLPPEEKEALFKFWTPPTESEKRAVR